MPPLWSSIAPLKTPLFQEAFVTLDLTWSRRQTDLAACSSPFYITCRLTAFPLILCSALVKQLPTAPVPLSGHG